MESRTAPPAPDAEIVELFFNDLTDPEVENLIGIVAGLDPYEMNEDEPKWSTADQFVIERFADLQRRRQLARVARVEATLAKEFESKDVVDLV